jgi:hypothetical protein
MMNLDYEKYGKCKKDTPYDEKVKMFEDNISRMLTNSTFIGQITKQNLSDAYELLKNENVLVPYLPIFRYNDKVMCMGKGEINNDFEHGKYAILTMNEITQFLEKGCTIFLYTVFDTKYNADDKLKYRCVILDENVD